MYRRRGDAVEVFLVHPGGPYWAKKDTGAWTVPKGEYDEGEDALATARREFEEETGFEAAGEMRELGTVKQKSGKVVRVWAFAGDCDPAQMKSNTCTIEWPPRTGKRVTVPEVDAGRWFGMANARIYIREEQRALLDAFERLVADEAR